MATPTTPVPVSTLDGLVGALTDVLRELVEFNSRQLSRSGTPFEIPAAVASTELRPANRWRHLVTVYNESTAVMYLSLGPATTPDSFTVKLNPDEYYETPAGYTGPVSAAWAAANGQARVTELA